MTETRSAPPPADPSRRWHTTAFRWLSVYALMFALSVMALMGFIGWLVTTTMEGDTDVVMQWQLFYFDSVADEKLADAIERRIDLGQMHANFYGLFTADGRHIAGDILAVPRGLPPDRTGHTFDRTLTLVPGEPVPVVRAMAELRRNDQELVLARDLTHVLRIRQTMIHALVGAGVYCLSIGIASGFLLSLRQMRRVRAIRRVTLKIAQGDLNQRLPVGDRDELDMLAQLVNHMLDEVERLMNEVKGASDGIAHDLRTPLAHIRTLLARIAERTGSLDDASIKGMVEQARTETDSLLDRFRAMLRISEIGALKRRAGFGTVDMCSLIGELCELYEPLAEQRSIQWIVHLDPVQPIQGDRALLFEACSNLLDNAIKFSPDGGMVHIQLTQAPFGPRLGITDNGPGIPVHEREAVLQRFYRSDHTRHISGSGLGLGIVTAVMRVHDFVLRISGEFPGTTMTVECWPHTLQ